jgi:hypothetical protein
MFLTTLYQHSATINLTQRLLHNIYTFVDKVKPFKKVFFGALLGYNPEDSLLKSQNNLTYRNHELCTVQETQVQNSWSLLIDFECHYDIE